MKGWLFIAGAVVALGFGVSATANAAVINVANNSFEVLPSGGLPNTPCGTNCAYSIFDPADPSTFIPGWNASGSGVGQFRPGPPVNTTYLNYVPDGSTAAFINDGTLSQTVTATAVAGVSYTLTVDVGSRLDCCDALPTVDLIVNGHSAAATGAAPSAGNWSAWTAVYTATASDAGMPITISLSSGAPQGDFDNVALSASAASATPEPAAWAMMLLGFGGVGGAMRSRRRMAAATI